VPTCSTMRSLNQRTQQGPRFATAVAADGPSGLHLALPPRYSRLRTDHWSCPSLILALFSAGPNASVLIYPIQVPLEGFKYTTGKAKQFKQENGVIREFCGNCGAFICEYGVSGKISRAPEPLIPTSLTACAGTSGGQISVHHVGDI